jgi:hypothetical protein
MFLITGRIYTINIVSEKKIQIVLKKQSRGKQVLLAIEVFGKWKYEADRLKLKKNDKISAVLFIQANIYKGKFYNDIYFEKISVFTEKPKPINTIKQETDMFIGEYGLGNKVIIDETTGKPKF